MACVCSQWEELRKGDETTAPYEQWLRRIVFQRKTLNPTADDLDAVKLCSKPDMTAKRFRRIKAFGNHFRVNDDRTETLDTYDCGVACLHEWVTEEGEVMKRHTVGEIMDILVLNYGKLFTPIILFRCTWIKATDNRGNPTYMRDRDGFLIVNYKHKEPKHRDPFIFPQQCIQIFFSDEGRREGWRVVMRKDSRSRRVVQDTEEDDIITTTTEPPGLSPPSVNNIPCHARSTVATELSDKENRLALAEYPEMM